MAARSRYLPIALLLAIIGLMLIATHAAAAETGDLPLFSIDVQQSDDPNQMSVILQIFLLLTVLSVAPALLIMLTCFTRVAIVLSVLRRAIGTQTMPPNQVVLGLSLFLTLFIMSPVWDQVNSRALQPYLEKEISQQQALTEALEPIRKFMFQHTREKDLILLVEIAKIERPANPEAVPSRVLIPAFILSELRTAFQIAFLLYVPFLIIDMVVASVLLSMGMMMLPPIMISMPFKLMLFVLADGWYLVVGSLVKSFG
ncbi:MAG TPA: flagellar type III secretion system pore protein FliP [Desulfobacterales bacterium]